MGDETDRRKKEEDDERVNWRLAEKMEKILKEKQEPDRDDQEGAGGCDIRAGAGGGEAGARGGLQGGQEAHGAAGRRAREETHAGQRQRRVGLMESKEKCREE